MRRDIEGLKTGMRMVQDGFSKMNQGPLSFTLETLLAAWDKLHTEHAPFKEGDRVILIETPDLSNSPGWHHSAHFLVKGAKATVVCCELTSKGFFGVDVVFDDESWIKQPYTKDEVEQIIPIEPDQRHTYGFNENKLVKF